ncbi:MAG: energy-coupled thiamine transporter ThiT [Clostridia bacterium]|nr:energy-coupled thiamine transporter ThiT [Clostridia bacterium]
MFLSMLSSSAFWGDVKNYFANFDGVTNTCRTVMLYIAIALLLAFVICKFAIKKDKQPLVNKVSLLGAIAFAVAIIVTFAVCSFKEDEIVAISFYPLLVFVIVCVVGALAVAVKPHKITKIAVAATVAASFVAAIVCLIVYYTSGKASDWNWISKEDVNSVGLYISSVVLVAGIALLAFFSDRGAKSFDSRSLSFAAVCVALSFALSYVRFFKMPMGGSITFASMLPVMLYSFMFGSRKGVIAGLVYGVLQAVQDPWILHPAQFILDYGAAFAAVGLAGCIKGFGLFKGKLRLQFTLGAITAGALRFVSHFFSGAFAFGSAGVGFAEEYGIAALNNPYFYSFMYQCLYVIPETVIVTVAGIILLSSRNFARIVEKYAYESHKQPKTEIVVAENIIEN